MVDRMDYRSSVFSWLSRKDKIFLLNGPSVQSFAPEAERFHADHPALIGVNYISDIESAILEKAGERIDIWVLFSADEVESSYQDIVDFLRRPDSIAILTTTAAFARIYDIVELNDVPCLHKVIFCDSIVEKVQRLTDLRYRTPELYASSVLANSLSLALTTMSLTPASTPSAVYLFGCDGADASMVEKVYFREETMRMGRRVTRERNIYQDMLAFEAIWDSLQATLVTARGLRPLQIFNANPGSFYSIFPKIAPNDIELRGENSTFTVGPFRDEDASTRKSILHLEMSRAFMSRLVSDTLGATRTTDGQGDSAGRSARPHDTRSETEGRLSIAARTVDVVESRLAEVQAALIQRTRVLETLQADLIDRTRRLEAANDALAELRRARDRAGPERSVGDI